MSHVTCNSTHQHIINLYILMWNVRCWVKLGKNIGTTLFWAKQKNRYSAFRISKHLVFWSPPEPPIQLKVSKKSATFRWWFFTNPIEKFIIVKLGIWVATTQGKFHLQKSCPLTSTDPLRSSQLFTPKHSPLRPLLFTRAKAKSMEAFRVAKGAV